MRISSGTARIATVGVLAALAGSLCIGLGLGIGPSVGAGHGLLLQPALAFDGTATPATASLTPGEALGGAPDTPENIERAKEFTELQYAADQGHPAAQWKLGRMYAAGDGVAQDDMRAFEYFSRIANAHAEDSPSAPQAQIVANAFVALGRYYLNGLPNSKVKADPDRAREMFSYAASYFGNAD